MNAYRYGGFWRRTIALSIDGILLHTFIIALFMAMKGMIPEYLFNQDMGIFSITASGIIYCSTTLVLNMVYFTYFHGVVGHTPGKKIMGLKVIQSSGKPMTLGIAFLRWVGYLVSRIFFFVGFLWVAFDRKKQGWHDKIAGTLVIRTRWRERRSLDETRGSHTGPSPVAGRRPHSPFDDEMQWIPY